MSRSMRGSDVGWSLGAALLLAVAACGGGAGEGADTSRAADTGAPAAVAPGDTAAGADTGATGAPATSAAAPLPACEPLTATLPAGFQASALAGRYRLRLVATGAGRSVTGTLQLQPMPDSLRHPLTLAGTADTSVSHPLFGTTDVDLEEVGALTAGDGTSADPTRPGALVVQWWTPAPSGGRATDVVVRIGSEANRRGASPFDGAYTVLRVSRADSAGFTGGWESGLEGRKTAGHFCADRMPQR